MFRPTLLFSLSTLAFLAAPGCDAARAAAMVGSTTLIAAPAAAPAAADQVKALYQRPDAVPFPETDRYTPAKALLGQMLFHDTRLSARGTLSCASCHNPALGYGDGLVRAIGHDSKSLPRRSPSILNLAWGDLMMWDGSAGSLEAQALIPLTSGDEMDQPVGALMQTLNGIQAYKPMLAAAFPNTQVTPIEIVAALATYERTIVSGPSAFDSWIEGDDAALSPEAKRGFALFNGKAHCALCHSGWNFTDNGFHDIGLPDADIGRGRLMPRIVKMQHAFKTPGLRDAAQRGPFMHDGSLPSLAAVVAFYTAGGAMRPSQSELVVKLHLSAEEQSDIVAFLETLSSTAQRDVVAALPR